MPATQTCTDSFYAGLGLRSGYQALFLDAGNTLFAPRRPIGECYAAFAGHFGIAADPARVAADFAREWQARNRVTDDPGVRERSWWFELVAAVFPEAGRSERFEIFFDALYDHFATAAAWTLYPEVPEFLSRAKAKGVRIGVVSNWDLRLPEVCRALGIADRVDFILCSAQAGAAKPRPEIFRQAAALSGHPLERTVHVGDSWPEDVLGARAAGLDAVWLQRGPLAPEDHRPRMGRLMDILDCLGGHS